MFTGLHHVNIVVADIERSKKFYTEVLGMQVTIETEIEGPEFSRGVGIPGAKGRMVFLAVPNTPTLLEVCEYVAPPKNKPVSAGVSPNDVGIGHLALQVQDIDAVCQRLQEKNVSFISGPVTLPESQKDVGGARFCYFRDPDGTLLELVYLPPAA